MEEGISINLTLIFLVLTAGTYPSKTCAVLLVKGVLPAKRVSLDSSGFLKGWGEMMYFGYWLGGDGLGGSGGFSCSAISSVNCWLSTNVCIRGLAGRGREAEKESEGCFLKDLGRVEDWWEGSLSLWSVSSRVSGSLFNVGIELARILWRNSASLA